MKVKRNNTLKPKKMNNHKSYWKVESGMKNPKLKKGVKQMAVKYGYEDKILANKQKTGEIKSAGREATKFGRATAEAKDYIAGLKGVSFGRKKQYVEGSVSKDKYKPDVDKKRQAVIKKIIKKVAGKKQTFSQFKKMIKSKYGSGWFGKITSGS